MSQSMLILLEIQMRVCVIVCISARHVVHQVGVVIQLRQSHVSILKSMLDHLVGAIFVASALMESSLHRNMLQDGVIVERVVIVRVDSKRRVVGHHGGYILNIPWSHSGSIEVISGHFIL